MTSMTIGRRMGMFLWGAALVLALGGPADAQLASSNWPMFHGGLTHTGQSAVSGPQTNNVKWTYPAGDMVKASPAIGADGTVYIAAGFSLCAVNPGDGSEQWCSRLAAESTRSAPAVTADTIYYGARDNRLYAFNLDGTIKWRYTIHNDGDVRTSPAVVPDGTVYFAGTWNGIVHAVDPAHGLDQATPYKAGKGILWSSPAVALNGTTTKAIYIGSTDGVLIALNPNLSLLWKLKLTGMNRNSSPAIGPGGVIYMGTTAGLSAVNPDGTLRWYFKTKGYVDATPAILDDGTIYVGTSTGRTFYALKEKLVNGQPQAQVLWSKLGTDAFPTSPAVGADGVIYVSMGKTVVAFNPNGTALWQFTTGNFINSSPALADDGTLYIGSSDGNLYAFGP